MFAARGGAGDIPTSPQKRGDVTSPGLLVAASPSGSIGAVLSKKQEKRL